MSKANEWELNRVWVNGVQMNGVLNGVHNFLNAEWTRPNFAELNAELNATKNSDERQMNAERSFSVQKNRDKFDFRRVI